MWSGRLHQYFRQLFRERTANPLPKFRVPLKKSVHTLSLVGCIFSRVGENWLVADCINLLGGATPEKEPRARTHTHTLSLSLTHTHTHTLSLSLALSFSVSLSTLQLQAGEAIEPGREEADPRGNGSKRRISRTLKARPPLGLPVRLPRHPPRTLKDRRQRAPRGALARARRPRLEEKDAPLPLEGGTCEGDDEGDGEGDGARPSPQPSTLSTKTLNPKPQTSNPKPSTLHPKPLTLNPQP